LEYPSWFQSRFLNWFAQKFEVDLSEACQESIEDYPTFAQFFARRLKEGARPIDKKAILVRFKNREGCSFKKKKVLIFFPSRYLQVMEKYCHVAQLILMVI
jgi:hypothetical protein